MNNNDLHIPDWSMRAAEWATKGRWLILLAAVLLFTLALQMMGNLKVSTKLEALMPEGAQSVHTLNAAMQKAGSFASIQVVIEGDDRNKIENTLVLLEAFTRRLPWADSVQYFEDISVLERHKLLQLSVPELEKVEKTLEEEVLAATTREFKNSTGIDLSINLVESGVKATSIEEDKPAANDNTADSDKLLEPIETERRFVSDDGRSQALVIWPKAGFEGLGEAKTMVSDVAAIIKALDLNAPEEGLRVGIAGRIRNKVAQFDAVMMDVVVGLGSSVSLIIVLLLLHYRRLVVVPLIILPLVTGIVWTIGITAVVIGGLNLITIFLALILFGLGIDFGIHNYSRYAEARAEDTPHIEAVAIVIGLTGKASLIAGLTTAVGFFALMFTEFRAFREFGFIAGSGILLIYTAMYTVFPALLSVFEGFINWHKRVPKESQHIGADRWSIGSRFPKATMATLLPLLLMASILAPQLGFEKNFKNIQAARSKEHLWATQQSKGIFKGGHDRAVLVVDSLEEVEKIEDYFAAYAKTDTETPTIAKLTSVRNFVPDAAEQAERLKVIKRMWEKIGEGALPEDLADQAKYLQVGELSAQDLPPAMRRVFLGDESQPGYLMYIYNSVTMDDADLARQFYDDAAEFTVNGKTYHPASEGFIFVEMLALMKADAIRAVSLVGSVTILLVLIFVRSFYAAAVVLLPTIAGLLITLALMTATGLPLSIINMVILPSLIGISVDNGIHIYERFQETSEPVGTVMATTGRAASITTLTTMLGFGGLVTASMGGLRSMGMLALLGFGTCLILTWTLLPALLKFLETRRRLKVAPYTVGTA